MIKYILIFFYTSMFSQTILGYKITDKDYHDQAGMVISGLAGSSAYFFDIKPFASCSIGFGAAGLAAAGKEIVWDLWLKNGNPDFWDGFSTCFGGLRMAVFLRIGINVNENKRLKLIK